MLSQKGPSGGYMLARPPARITMADVVEIIEGDYYAGRVPGGRRNSLSARAMVDARCATCGARCATASSSVSSRSATLQSLAERRKSAVMYQNLIFKSES